MRSPIGVCSVLALALLACALLLAPSAVEADHCFATCCSIGWSHYGYGNITKRAAATTGDSSCNCASEEAFSCDHKPSGPSSAAVRRSARGSQTPNDSCYGACCPGVQPDMKDRSPAPQFQVNTYGYSDFEIVQSSQGPCLCYADVLFQCARSVQLE